MAISDRDNSLSMFLMEKSVDDLGVGFPQALELSVQLLEAPNCDDANAPVVIDNTLSRHHKINRDNPKEKKCCRGGQTRIKNMKA